MNDKLNKPRLKSKCLVIGFFIISLIICFSLFVNYEFAFRNLVHSNGLAAQQQINQSLVKQTKSTNYDLPVAQLELLSYYLQSHYHDKDIAIFNHQGELLWLSESAPKHLASDLLLRKQANQGELGVVYGFDYKTFLLQLFKPSLAEKRRVDWYIPIKELSSKKVSGLVVLSGKSNHLSQAISAINQPMMLVGIVSLFCLFILLYWALSRADKTIKLQSRALRDQILRLSNIIAINKNMQKNMRSASSRAVELNEQFLRRVGSDLHDGPAQTIGYALLRLDKVNQQEQSMMFNQEYHTVKDALTSALEEIRGISSGLVLPELDSMTLQECFKKVVKRHVKNTKGTVKEYYKNLPEQVPLPIQICAYRFVQEALNNAHRHGEASECRLSAMYEKGELRVTVKDNGKGFRMKKLNTDNQQLGLLGLKDRVESLGGNFDIDSELGVGSKIKMSILLGEEYN